MLAIATDGLIVAQANGLQWIHIGAQNPRLKEAAAGFVIAGPFAQACQDRDDWTAINH